MTPSPNPYRGFRFPAEIIEHAVWLYHCFSLSLRDVELILAAHGVVASYETIRDWQPTQDLVGERLVELQHFMARVARSVWR